MNYRVWSAILGLATVAAMAQDQDDPVQRRRYFEEERGLPGRVPIGARLRALQALDDNRRAIQSGKLGARAAGTTGAWKFIGPRPIDYGGGYFNSGRISALAIDPRDNDVVYAGGADGGVWKTSDGGTTWTPLGDDQPSLSIGAIAIDPSNPNTVYVGTGEQDFSGDSYFGAGILKSTDAGATWKHIPGPFVQRFIGGMAVHPTDGATVLTASSIGLYRSTDAGETWSLVRSGQATAVFFDPNQPGIAWAALGTPAGSTLNGVYRSTDAGATWRAVPGTAPLNLPAGSTIGRIQIVNAPASPDTTYAVVSNRTSSLNGIYRTTDAGATWINLGAPDFCNPQCNYDIVIQPHPLDPSIVIAGGSTSVVRSLNGGASWQSQGTTRMGLTHADHHAMVFTRDGTRLYDGNDGGAWSTDAFQGTSIVWNDLNATLGLTEYYPGQSIHPTNPQMSLAGSQDNGSHLYGGQLMWTQVFGGDGGWTAIDPSVPNFVYVSTQNISLYRANSLGATDPAWQVTNGINKGDRHRFIASFVMDPTNTQRMYYGTYKVYQSIDGGGVWRAISPDLTDGPDSTTSSFFTISSIAVSPANPDTIYTGAISGAVYQTTDGGASWTSRAAGLPFRAVTRVLAHPLERDTVYLTFSGYPGASDTLPGHIYRSTDGGNTWVDMSGNLPNIPANELVIDPDLPDTFYAATDAGVMVTTDGGNNWTTLGAGLPRVVVLSLVLHRPTRTLRAATYGRSMWDYALPAVASAQPVISSLAPATRNAGEAAFTLTINGSNLGSGMRVRWNGQDRQVVTATANRITVQIPAGDINSVGRATVAVFNPSPGGGLSIPASFTIGPAPVIGQGGLVSAANPLGGSTASPGALVSLYGANLSGQTVSATDSPIPFPLPSMLNDVIVTLAGTPVPLYFVSPSVINFQMPFSVSNRIPQTVVVMRGTQVSATAQLTMAAVTPALFSMNQQGSGQGAIRIADATGAIAAPSGAFSNSRPAKRREYISIYCTGLGVVTPAGTYGAAAPSSPLQKTVVMPTVTIGGVPAAAINFSGLTPGVAGLYQVNAQIPDDAPSGDAIPVVVTISGVKSNTVTVAIQ